MNTRLLVELGIVIAVLIVLYPALNFIGNEVAAHVFTALGLL